MLVYNFQIRTIALVQQTICNNCTKTILSQNQIIDRNWNSLPLPMLFTTNKHKMPFLYSEWKATQSRFLVTCITDSLRRRYRIHPIDISPGTIAIEVYRSFMASIGSFMAGIANVALYWTTFALYNLKLVQFCVYATQTTFIDRIRCDV